MYYNYHAKNLQRIKNGELIDVKESCDKSFAFVLIFSTHPYTRPIRPHSVYRYENLLKGVTK